MRSGRRRGGWPTPVGIAAAGLFLLSGMILFNPSTACAAGPRIEVVDARVGFGDRFQIGAWTPVRVQVRAGAEAFDGFLEVSSKDDDGTPVRSRQILRVGAAETVRLNAYTRPGSRTPDFRFRFLDKDLHLVQEVSLESVRTGSKSTDRGDSFDSEPQPLYPEDLTLLALGRPQGVELLAKLPSLTANRQGTTREVFVSRLGGLETDSLPGRPEGYDAFDAVVVDTNDKDLLAAFSTRGEPLIQWVARGGHLVVAVGSNWQAVRDSPLAAILPVKIAGSGRVTDLRALESFAGATTQITPDNVAAQVVKLEGAEASGAKVLSTTSSSPLVVRGKYGFGRVTVIAFDVDAPPFADWPDRALFWIKALDLGVSGSLTIGATKTGGRLVQSGASDLSTLLRSALDQFPEVRLVPFGWVAFLIFIYILLIGPFDYFFLKKVVKRMEWTWVTFPLIVIVVSLTAAYAAYSIKGTELRVNQIDLVDVDETAKQVRGFSFINIFSPANRDYEIGLRPLAIAPGSPTEAPDGTNVRISWLGSADSGLRGMNGGSRALTFANLGYRYAPDASVERLESLRIPIWSTKSLESRWFGPSSGVVVEADLQQVGPDRLTGTVTNRLDVTLRETILAFGTQVYYNLGEIAPGASVRVELTLNRQLSGYLGELRRTYDSKDDTWNGESRLIHRANLLRAILFHESENFGTDPLSSRPLKELDLTTQLRLDRPMLVAKIDRPVAEWRIAPAASEPKITRTTLIRVILPLDRGGETPASPTSPVSPPSTPSP